MTLRFQPFQVSPWYLSVTAIIEEDFHIQLDKYQYKYQLLVQCYARLNFQEQMKLDKSHLLLVMPLSLTAKGPLETRLYFHFSDVIFTWIFRIFHDFIQQDRLDLQVVEVANITAAQIRFLWK